MRPYGFLGNPFFPASSSVHVLPPSTVRKRPLPLGASGPSPPDRNVQPFLRKSHIPAIKVDGFCGSMLTPEQPVDRFPPFKIRFQVLPPSIVLYNPLSGESLHSFPGTQA